MMKQEFVFRKKGNICTNAAAARRLCSLNDPEIERFFSVACQNEIAAVLEEAKNAMRRYREVKAHDYMVEDFSDECASRPLMASELVCRPHAAELGKEVKALFLTDLQRQKLADGHKLWEETLRYWVDYVNSGWVEMFGTELF